MSFKNAKQAFKIGLVVIVITGIAVVAHATITSGLVGWWKFTDGYGITIPDSSGGANTGLLSGAAYLITDPQKGQVMNANGVSAELEIPYSPSLTPVSGTVSVWVKPSQSVIADVVHMDSDLLVACNRAGTFYAFDLRITAKGAPEAIVADDNPKTCGKVTQIVAAGTSKVPLNVWTHLAMSWANGSLLVYQNGKEVGSASYLPDAVGISYHGGYPLEAASAALDFGGYLEYFGQISDMRMYSRALTATEIAQIAAGQ